MLTHEHTDPRMPAHEQVVLRAPLNNDQVSRMKTDMKHFQETAAKPTAPINNTPIATRTRAAQPTVKQLQAAAKEVTNTFGNKLLEKPPNKHGYFQSTIIPGLWTYTTRPIQFMLVVDDFGVKYVGK